MDTQREPVEKHRLCYLHYMGRRVLNTVRVPSSYMRHIVKPVNYFTYICFILLGKQQWSGVI